ncbi:MAG TPA: PHP domain-containing protein [Armatimonadetes bacterium]|nr:PHP domain-containing protein [Armatimonadota bacterium]
MALEVRFDGLADLHVHTERSPCAVAGFRVRDAVEEALKKGVRLLAITDHYHGPGNRPALEALREEVEEVRKEFGEKIVVLLGAEADILTVDGELSIEPEVARTLDVLLAAPHFVPAGGRCLPTREKGKVTFSSPKFREIVEGGGLYDFLADFRDMLVSVVEGGLASIIAHPLLLFPQCGLADRNGGPIRSLLDIGDEGYWERVLKLALRRRVCFEVSGKVVRADSCWGGTEQFVKRAASMGVKISTASDAHRPEDVGELGEVLSFLRRCGVPPRLVVLSPSDLRRPCQEI